MTEIIPAIIAQDFQELGEKIRKIEPYVDWAQLDIMDGKFVDGSTWNNPKELENLKTKLNLEAHLMIDQPEKAIGDWIDSGVKRIVIHFESSQKIKEVIEKTRGAGIEIGLALNPTTPIEVLDKYLPEINLILIMTVEPGKGGQGLLPETLIKIEELRQKYPKVKIGADGGINLATAPEAVRAGADVLSIGSAIFDSDNIGETIKRLKHAND